MMNIQELERRTGILKQNIRFYEKKGLLHPSRNTQNNYREYTDEDVRALQTIQIFRKLDVSLEDIRSIQEGSRSMEEVLRDQLRALQERQKELDAGIRVCQDLLLTDLSRFEPEQVLERMDTLEKEGGRFMSIIHDFKKIDEMESRKAFSFFPDTMVQNKEEFTEALFRYAEENHLNLVITEEGMHPVFEIDGVEYTARREFRKGWPPAAVIYCRMTQVEDAELELQDIPMGRKRIMRFLSRYMVVIFLAVFLVLTERPMWVAALLLVGLGPVIYMTCRGR